MEEALLEARQLGHVYSLAKVLIWTGWVACIANSPHENHRYVEEAVALSDLHGFSDWLGWGLIYRAWYQNALGSPQEGVTLATKGLQVLRGSGAVTSTPFALTLIAEMYGKFGRITEGLACLAEAAQIIERTEERMNEAELYRVRGDFLNATGDRSAAEGNYRLALAVAERQSAKVFELRSATSLARLWRDQGKSPDAQALLAPIYAWFTEGFDAPDLKDAKALLNDLETV